MGSVPCIRLKQGEGAIFEVAILCTSNTRKLFKSGANSARHRGMSTSY